MKKSIFILLLAIVFVAPGFLSEASGVESNHDMRDSVVKVFVNKSRPDYFLPWQKKGSHHTSGSGCIIEGNRILTNAHVISDQTFLEVKKSADPKRYVAHVESLGHDCDLAILRVDDPTFFEGTQPIPLGDLPMLQDTVSVIGFPVGGEQLSITEGVVSRIDVRVYVHSRRKLMAVQIDAAINPGNSGGPVVKDGKLVGVAFQGLIEGDNIGYIIPAPVVKHFLTDLQDGQYEGFPQFGIHFNKLENPSIRQSLGVSDEKDGILLTRVDPISPVAGILKEGDVLTAVDGILIAGDATVAFRDQERVFFSYAYAQKQMGETVNVEVIRDGNPIMLELELKPFRKLVPYPYTFEEPPYYVYGGLVFTVLSQDLLDEWEDETAPNSFMVLNHYTLGPGRARLKNREDIPLLLKVLPDDINVGYHRVKFHVVKSVNGKPIQSFKDLVLTLDSLEGPYADIETERFYRIILDRGALEDANERITEKYHLPSLYSEGIAEWVQ